MTRNRADLPLFATLSARSVKQFGAVGDGVTDDAAAFARAAESANKLIVVEPGTYVLNTAIAILAGQTWLFVGNPTITHTDATKNLFTATTVNDWEMRGNAKFLGLGSGSAGNEIGLVVTDCENYKIDGLYFTGFRNRGIELRSLSDTTPSTYRKRGFLNDVVIHDCRVTGLYIGAESEYNQIQNVSVTNCNAVSGGSGSTGIECVGGNNFFSNTKVTDCVIGVKIPDGDNGGHGTWVGGCINHATNIGLWIVDTLGFTFNGLAIYGNASNQGDIYLDGCASVLFSGCDIATRITAGTQPTGMTLFDGCNLRSGNNFSIATGMTLASRQTLRFSNCIDGTALSTYNDPLGGGSPATITIASGVAAKPINAGFGTALVIDTEAAAATDDLDTITAGKNGEIITVRAANTARTVVCKNGTGNLKLAGSDFSLDNTDDTILLMSNGTNWLELCRASNGA